MSKPERDMSLDQWFTPRLLAAQIVRLAGVLPCDTVLEPAAGSGTLVCALQDASADVTAYETDLRWVAYLKTVNPMLKVTARDFLKAAPPQKKFDHVVMNPPFSYNGKTPGLDTAFLEHAMRFGHRVTALLRLTALSGIDRATRVWLRSTMERIEFLPRRPKFGGSGSARSDFVIVKFRQNSAPTSAPSRALVGWADA